MNQFLHCLNVGVLGCHVVGLLIHFSYKVHISVSEISHYRPVLCSRLRKVIKGFLNSHQVVVSVAALARGFLPLSEVVLCLYEVGLEVCPVLLYWFL